MLLLLECWSQNELSYCHWFVKSGLSKLSANHAEFSWNGNVSSKVKWKTSRNIPLCILVLLALYDWWPTLHGMFSVSPSHVLTFRSRRSAYFFTKSMKSCCSVRINLENILKSSGRRFCSARRNFFLLLVNVQYVFVLSSYNRARVQQLNSNCFVPWKTYLLWEFYPNSISKNECWYVPLPPLFPSWEENRILFPFHRQRTEAQPAYLPSRQKEAGTDTYPNCNALNTSSPP